LRTRNNALETLQGKIKYVISLAISKRKEKEKTVPYLVIIERDHFFPFNLDS